MTQYKTPPHPHVFAQQIDESNLCQCSSWNAKRHRQETEARPYRNKHPNYIFALLYIYMYIIPITFSERHLSTFSSFGLLLLQSKRALSSGDLPGFSLAEEQNK